MIRVALITVIIGFCLAGVVILAHPGDQRPYVSERTLRRINSQVVPDRDIARKEFP